MGRRYDEGCNSDICTTIWLCDAVVFNLSMIRTTECSETLSETASIRAPGMFATLFQD